MKQIIAIGGEPACGKTSLMRGIIARLGEKNFSEFKYGLLRGLFSKTDNVFILGIYGKETFAGTDRLSMAVINDAVKFLDEIGMEEKYQDTVLLFEGDRLFNKRFLQKCKDTAATAIMVLECSEEEKEKRHKLRNDTQTSSWLKSRSTKLLNLLSDFPEAKTFRNDTEIDLSKNFFSILSLVDRREIHS